jgi:hypothetical protein
MELGMHGLSSNPAITSELVLQTLDKGWFWNTYLNTNMGLSCNKAITLELVLRTLDKDWNWGM